MMPVIRTRLQLAVQAADFTKADEGGATPMLEMEKAGGWRWREAIATHVTHHGCNTAGGSR